MIYPSLGSSDPEEKEEAVFLRKLRGKYRDGVLEQHIIDKIEKEFPGFEWRTKGSHLVFRSFPKARKFALSLNLKSRKEWRKYWESYKKPNDIPFAPDQTYGGKGWKNWGDFLGTKNFSPKRKGVKWKDYEFAKRYAQTLNLKTFREWTEYCKSGKKPNDIPTSPNEVYGKQFEGYGVFLGVTKTQTRRRSRVNNWRSYSEAEKYVRSKGIKNSEEWRDHCRLGKRPKNIPSNLHIVYSGKGWKGWKSLFGKD